MEESLILQANVNVVLICNLNKPCYAVHSDLRDRRISVSCRNVPYRARNTESAALDKVVAEHIKCRLALFGILPKVVDIVPGRVAVVDVETERVDDLDLLIIGKCSAEADKDGIKSRIFYCGKDLRRI